MNHSSAKTISYATLFGEVLYPFYETSVRKRKTFSYISEYEKNQWLGQDALEFLRLEKLKKLLEHCQQNVPYYMNEWRRLGFDWRDVNSVKQIDELPTISKEVIRERYTEFKAMNWDGRYLTKATGGTTGVPFKFNYTRESYERRVAVAYRGYGWAGARPGVKRLDVWGVDILPVGLLSELKNKALNVATRRKVLSCFKLNLRNIEEYIREIELYKPKVIVGYTSALVTIAKWSLKNRLSNWAPNSIITGAEMLSEDDRLIIENAFRAPVFHTYGCREFMLIGAECEYHRGYHVSADHLIVQILDEDGREISHGTGNVAITDLHNFAMPFVRYTNGDLAEMDQSGQGACECGRVLPLLKKVVGRSLDQIRTPDGKIIPGEFFPHLFKDFQSIHQFQVIQKTLSELEINLVLSGDDADNQLAKINGILLEVLGIDLKININLVDTISLTSSGKLRVTISELDSPA